MAKLTWHGNKIQTDMNDAARKALDQTLADCVAHAQQPPPTGAPRDTGAMAGNITFRPAIEQGSKITGWFGNVTQDYVLIQETKNGFLRRAADKMFPTLAARIREQTR